MNREAATHRQLRIDWFQRGRSLALVVAAILGASVLFAPSALASGRPIVESLTATASLKEEVIVGLEGEITVDASVDPKGVETTYETWLECVLCGESYDYAEGSLPAVDEVRAVTFVLNDLQRGEDYQVAIRVRNAAGESFRLSGDVEVPESLNSFPTGAAPVGVIEAPYLGAASGQLLAIAEREARERSERELKEREAHELWERVPASMEAGARKEAEVAATARQRVRACVVPSLRGDTLSAAGRVLAHAHCRLGKVSRPRHHHGNLFVTRQAPRPGERLRATADVTLVLAPKAASQKH
jgi:hypothetical protein